MSKLSSPAGGRVIIYSDLVKHQLRRRTSCELNAVSAPLADRLCATPETARALRSSVRLFFSIPVPIMMLRAAKALGLPVPFTRDQIDRLVLPKAYDSVLARLDYDFQPQCFLDYLTQSGKITTPRMGPRDESLSRVAEQVNRPANMLLYCCKIF